MKYPESMYIGAGLFDGDMDVHMEHHHEKVVKVRKDHECASCQRKIEKDEYAVNESAIFPYEGGWKSCYICEDCINKWLEETIAKLDDCPFCGSKADIQSNDFGYPHFVYCTKCGAKIHGGLQGSEEASVMASIEAWNRRV